MVVGGKTSPTPTPPSSALTAVGQSFTSICSNALAVAGTTLSQGGQGTTISGTPVSVGPSDLIIGSKSLPLQNSHPSFITALGQYFTPIASDAIAITGTTLFVGGPGVTVSEIPVSVGSEGLVMLKSTFPTSTGTGGDNGGPII